MAGLERLLRARVDFETTVVERRRAALVVTQVTVHALGERLASAVQLAGSPGPLGPVELEQALRLPAGPLGPYCIDVHPVGHPGYAFRIEVDPDRDYADVRVNGKPARVRALPSSSDHHDLSAICDGAIGAMVAAVRAGTIGP